eukprot:PhF_6_TR28153/c0_g1_i1/m.41703
MAVVSFTSPFVQERSCGNINCHHDERNKGQQQRMWCYRNPMCSVGLCLLVRRMGMCMRYRYRMECCCGSTKPKGLFHRRPPLFHRTCMLLHEIERCTSSKFKHRRCIP